MNIVEELLGLKLIESVTESPNWESTWWDTVFRGLQEDIATEQCPTYETTSEAGQRTDS
jgi:hypothetical protein